MHKVQIKKALHGISNFQTIRLAKLYYLRKNLKLQILILILVFEPRHEGDPSP